jgi:integrase
MLAIPDTLKGLTVLAMDTRWANTRSRTTNYSHAMSCVAILEDMGVRTPDSLASDHLKALVARLEERGDAPATIIRKLNCLKAALGDHAPPLQWPWPKLPRTKKWWLKPDAMAKLLPLLRDAPDATPRDRLLADFIEWTCHTGLRVEESLGVLASDFDPNHTVLHIRGTKSINADRHIALDRAAVAVAYRRLGPGPRDDALLFATTYAVLVDAWERVRFLLKLDQPTATLKALRRTAAWYRTVEDGMPAQVLQHYLGHAEIDTTMGYLRLTGDAFGVEVQRRWIKT